MTREIALFITLGILVLGLFAAWWGWRRRTKKYSHLPALPSASSLSGTLLGSFSVMYMATTDRHNPLERIARSPLAFRSKALLLVRQDGVGVELFGEGDVAISRGSIVGVGVATWTIDKVVDSDGLVFIRWMWGPLEVESYFRVVDHPRDDVISAVQSITGRVEGQDL